MRPRHPLHRMWAGALMYGPLVMTATDMESWDDASVSMASDLSDIEPLGAREGKGYEANVYALRFHGKEFLPDYYTDHNTTHYLRLDIQGDPSAEYKQTIRGCHTSCRGISLGALHRRVLCRPCGTDRPKPQSPYAAGRNERAGRQLRQGDRGGHRGRLRLRLRTRHL